MEVKKLSEGLAININDDVSNKELLVKGEQLLASLNKNLEKLNFSSKEFCTKESDKQVSALASSNEKLIDLYSQLLTKAEFNGVIESISGVANQHQQVVSANTSKLVEAINVIPTGSYSLAITSGVVGAIIASVAAFLANFFYQKYVNQKNKSAHFADVALVLLKDFENTAIEYWVSAKIRGTRNKNNNETDMKLLEVKIKSEFLVLKACLSEFSQLVLPVSKSHKEQVDKFIDDVYDECMGGDFESDNKKSEKSVAIKVSKLCARLKSILLKYSQYST